MTGNGLFRKLAIATMSLALAWMALAPRTTAFAGEQPNLLVVGDDADQDTVPRNSRIFNRVSAAITSDLTQRGFKVYDEAAVSMDITNPGRVRRTDAELISIAQRIPKPPVDVIVVFQVYASVQQNAYSDIKELRVRIPGRMIQVQTGKALGNFEVAMGPRNLKPLPVNCNRDCVLESVGNAAEPIAHEVGIVLAAKLDQLSPIAPNNTVALNNPPAGSAPLPAPAIAPRACTGMSSAYRIVLKGFDPHEADWMEQIMMAFYGYEHHRPVRTMMRYAEYWYETCSGESHLEHNLRAMLDELHDQYRLTYAANRFEIEKIPAAAAR